MRIAIQDCFPNMPISAEKRFIKRAIEAFSRLGHEAAGVETSDDILSFSPDLVLVTHEFTPKLVDVPTVGLIWTPVSLMSEYPYRLRNLLSYDGYFPGSPAIRVFLHDLLFSAGKTAPVGDFVYPSCFNTVFEPRSLDNFSLFYAGVGWDKDRFRSLFEILDGDAPLQVYGASESWEFLKHSYAGSISVNGDSVLERIRRSGVALCLHRPEWRGAGVPSLRIFESAAAGAVILCDDFSFARDHFRDAMLFVDGTASPGELAKQIKSHLKWIADNQGEAMEMAKRSHSIFSQKFCLEQLFKDIESFTNEVRSQSHYFQLELDESRNADTHPVVEYIIRVGMRPARFVRRSLASLANQTYKNIGIVMVVCGEVEGLEAVIEEFKPLFKSFKIIDVDGQPPGLRSTALWTGLRAVSAPLFGNLDDDDELHMNHVAALVEALLKSPHSLVAYSGTVRVEEDDGFYFIEPNFFGPEQHVIKERRRLQFLDAYDKERLLECNYVQSNAWLAKREILDERILTDPFLPVVEDVYLFMCFATKTSFTPTWRASAVWNWRSANNDNICSSPAELWTEPIQRIRNRLAIDTGTSKLLRLHHNLARDLSFYGVYEVDAPRAESLRATSGRLSRLIRKGISILRKEGLRSFVFKTLNRIERAAGIT